MKKLIALLLAMVLATTVIPFSVGVSAATDKWDGTIASKFASGSGSESDPFIIKTAEQFAFFSDLVNKIEKNRYYVFHVKLMADLVLNDTSKANWYNNAKVFTPIGSFDYSNNENNPFGGVFDGNGHTITGLCIKSNGTYMASLFPELYEGAVKNLNLKDVYVSGTKYVGAIVGYNYGSVISNCSVSGIVKGSDYYVGGVVGHSNSYSTISDCTNHAEVKGVDCVGGIVGYSFTPISGCKNTGKISGYENVGGIAGTHYYDQISNCTNSGSIYCTEEPVANTIRDGDYAGGIVGSCASNIINCTNNGAVYGNSSVGGLVGLFNFSAEETGVMRNGVNNGVVFGGYDRFNGNTESTSTGYNTGGLAGSVYNAKITNSVNNAEVKCYDDLGGLFGRLSNESNAIYCFNNGKVTGLGTSTTDSAGGIVGYLECSKISRCVNNGTVEFKGYAGGIAGDTSYSMDYNTNQVNICSNISDSYNTGAVSGKYIGGIVGYNALADITNCYNVGTMTTNGGSSSVAAGITAVQRDKGGRMGKLTSCYYLAGGSYYSIGYYYDDNYNIIAANSDTSNAKSLTSEQMKKSSNFVGYDFDKIWVMDASTAYAYPELREYKEFQLGDVNMNGQIDARDYVNVKRAYFKTYKLSAEAELLADINQNGIIDARDYVNLKRAYFGTYKIPQV